MKNLLKILIPLAVIILAIIVVWELFIAPSFSKSSQCFLEETTAINTAFQKAETMSPGVERNQFICSEDEVSYRNLINCFKLVKEDNKLGFAVYSKLPKFKNTINETISTHNDLCPDNPLSSPAL